MRKWLVLGVPFPFLAMMWGACSTSPSTPDGGGNDGTVADTAIDKKILPDVSNQMETGPMCPTPATSIDTSMITWVPPITPSATACSGTQAGQYYADCLSTTSSSTLCNGFAGVSSNATCLACLVSSSTMATSYGALVTYGGIDYANIAGCVSLETGDVSSMSCGAKLQAVTSCEQLACAAICPVTDQASFTLYTQCATAADNGICHAYVEAECDLADSGIDGAANAAAVCESAADFQGYYDAMSTVFCGDYAGDAGDQ